MITFCDTFGRLGRGTKVSAIIKGVHVNHYHRIAVGLLLAFGSLATARATQYIVVGKPDASAGQLASQVGMTANGVIVRALPQIGMYVVNSNDAGYAQRLATASAVKAVVRDPTITLHEPANQPFAANAAEAQTMARQALAAGAPLKASANIDMAQLASNRLYQLQWALRDVHATTAWSRGYTGAGVRVAVLDSGIDCNNAWLAPNIDFSALASFVPGEAACVRPGYFFNHGTHVAGIIAALPSAFGTVGIAPGATLVPVKVLSEYSGSGSFSGVVAGILYAADAQADVINMSLGAYPLPASDPGVQDLVTVFQRAVSYAKQKGAVTLVAAGNDGVELGAGGNIGIPANVPGVISISATGPMGWATGRPQFAYLDYLADYSNYGQGVTLAGPGGAQWYYYVNSSQTCPYAGYNFRCYVLDLVLSNSPGGWYFAAGTSMATPAASAVAALAIQRARVAARIPTSYPAALMMFKRTQAQLVTQVLNMHSLDIGPVGTDMYFGYGHVDADRVTSFFVNPGPPADNPYLRLVYPEIFLD